jgi:hypothetical protein
MFECSGMEFFSLFQPHCVILSCRRDLTEVFLRIVREALFGLAKAALEQHLRRMLDDTLICVDLVKDALRSTLLCGR